MILVVCLPCAFALRVMPVRVGDTGSVDELETLVGKRSSYWPDKYPCPRCDKPTRGMREHEADPNVLHILTLVDVTPQEAFAALNGLGLPNEQECSFDVVQELLRTHPVRNVIGNDIARAGRMVIDALELWDGTKIHLGSGMEGAIVYRISRPPAYAEKVLAGEPR